MKAMLDGPGAPEARTNGHSEPRATDRRGWASPAERANRADAARVNRADAARANRADAARAEYRASVAAGAPLSGAELGRRHDMSPQWGRGVGAAVRAEDVAPALAAPSADTADSGAAMAPEPTAKAAPVIAMAPPADRHTRPWSDTAITLVVALVAAAASYAHMLDVALLAGEPVWVARAFPITVDGLVIAALRRGEHGRRWLALGLVLSVAANVLANFPDLAADAGPAVSAVPPLAL